MKQIIMTIKKIGFFLILLLGFTACNKEEERIKAVSVQLAGYNIGNSELEVSIDEVTYDKFKTPANKRLDFRKVYTYPSSKSQALLKIRDLTSGKEVYQQQLKLNSNELTMFFPFVFVNGSQVAITPTTPDPSTNKIAFYLYNPQSNDAVDIFLKNDAGQIGYIAKNVLPSTWSYSNYITAEGFKDSEKARLYFVKTGTTDQWAFNGSEQLSNSPLGTLLLPGFEERGLVCTYFVTPGNNQLDVARLFKGSE